jgi:CRISPR-associated protein Cmr3
MTTYLRILPRDPLVARDGRPFGANSGNRMRSTGWPTPSVVAGSFRTALGKRFGVDFQDAAVLKKLKDIEVAGVLPVAVAERENDPGELLLPAPFDCVVDRNRKAHAALPRPLQRGEGCDWPDGLDLLPVTLDEKAPDDKAETGPAFWPLDLYAAWLTGRYVSLADERFVAAAEPDLRDHVEIEDVSGTARDARLFTTAGVAVAALERTNSGERKGFDRKRRTRLTARVENLPADWAGLDTLHLG